MLISIPQIAHTSFWDRTPASCLLYSSVIVQCFRLGTRDGFVQLIYPKMFLKEQGILLLLLLLETPISQNISMYHPFLLYGTSWEGKGYFTSLL
jgi:hypothetical protein